MSLFSRESKEIETPLTSGGLSCDHGSCDHLSDIDLDDPNEELDREAKGIIKLVDKGYDAIHAAAGDLQFARDDAHKFMDEYSANRHTRRHNRRSMESSFNSLKRSIRADVAEAIAENLGEDWDTFPATETSLIELTKFRFNVDRLILKKKIGQSHVETIDELRVQNAYITAMLSELQIRASIAIVQQVSPDFTDRLFQYGALEDLPESVQRVIAADLQRGEKGSVIMCEAKRIQEYEAEEEDPTPDQRIFEFIASGDMSKEARSFFRAVSIGAAAMGATQCPSNEFGICKRVIERLSIPDDILREVDRKDKSNQQLRYRKLKAFANNFGSDPLRLNCKDVPTSPDTVETEAPIRKRGVLRSIIEHASKDLSPEVSDVAESHFDKVTVQITKHQTIDVDPSNVDSVDQSIDAILNSKAFAEYAKAHTGSGIEDFLAYAVKTILFIPAHKEASISAIKEAGNYYIDDQPAQLYRLTGRALAGSGGGSIGRDTRILFASSCNGRERVVEFVGVKQKGEVETGHLLRRLLSRRTT